MNKKTLFATAMAFMAVIAGGGTASAAYPEGTAINGQYTMTADVTFGDGYSSDSAVKAVLDCPVTFTIFSRGSGIRNFLGNITELATSYDQTTGKISFLTNNIGSVGGFNAGSNATLFGMQAIGSTWAEGMCNFTWQVSEKGVITSPDFEIVDFGKANTPVVATYRNVKIKGANEPDTPGFPTLSEIAGYYKFTSADFVLNDETVTTLKGNFDFTISVDEDGLLSVNHFLYNNFQIGTGVYRDRADYDENTGILTFKTFTVVQNTATLYGIAPGGYWSGISGTDAKRFLTFQFQEDGTVVIPDFEVITFAGAEIKSVVAEYADNTAAKADPNGGDEGEIVADQAIEGIWNISYFDIMNSSKDGAQGTGEYHAYLNGNTVTFEEQGSGDAEGREGTYHIVGKFTDAKTILIQRAVVGDPNSANPLYQVPFTNGKEEVDASGDPTYLNENSWSLTFDAEAGTLTPPEGNNGVKYAYYEWGTTNQTEDTSLQAAYIVQDGKKVSGFVPTVTISSLVPTVTGNSVTVAFNVETERFEGITPAKWEALLTQRFSDIEAETEWTEEYTIPCTVNGTNGSFTYTGLQGGNNDFVVMIVAYTAAGDQIAVSNSKSFTAETDGYLTISGTNFVVDDNTLKITCKITPTGVALGDIAEYEGVLTNMATSAVAKTREVTADGDNLSLSFIIPSAGTYNFLFEINGYDASGIQVAFSSSSIQLTGVEVSGVEGIEADGGIVRYFNLQGVEIARPAHGEIVIKVAGGKAVKVVE